MADTATDMSVFMTSNPTELSSIPECTHCVKWLTSQGISRDKGLTVGSYPPGPDSTSFMCPTERERSLSSATTAFKEALRAVEERWTRIPAGKFSELVGDLLQGLEEQVQCQIKANEAQQDYQSLIADPDVTLIDTSPLNEANRRLTRANERVQRRQGRFKDVLNKSAASAGLKNPWVDSLRLSQAVETYSTAITTDLRPDQLFKIALAAQTDGTDAAGMETS